MLLKKNRNVVLTTVLFEVVMNMTSASVAANASELWYMNFEPIFERSYKVAENGKSVEKTESLSSEEVDEIIQVLSLNPDFISVVQSYMNAFKSADASLSDEQDSEMHARIIGYIDELIEGRDLRMGYFFSNSISLEVFQRVEAGRIGVKR